MSTRPTRDQSTSRAEARRRARRAARGEVPETAEDEQPDTDTAEPREGLLRKIFPPAPPLPDKPDPMLGFDPEGPMTPVRERIFLLRQNPAAWVLLGLLSGFAFIASRFYGGSALALIATFVHFGALITAGWFGWQRPTLYGVATAAVAFVGVTIVILSTFTARGADPETFGDPSRIVLSIVLEGLYFLAFGFLGGWYGGYLRRRQAQVSRDVRSRR